MHVMRGNAANSSSSRFRGARLVYSGNDDTSRQLSTRAPFHLEATVRVLQRRPANLVEAWEHERYLRVLRTSDDLVLVEVQNVGTIDEPDVRYALRHGDPSTVARRELAQTLRKVLGLDVDPIPMQRLVEADRKLRPTAVALRGMRPPRFAEWFETFANVVPFQQVSLDAGVATRRALWQAPQTERPPLVRVSFGSSCCRGSPRDASELRPEFPEGRIASLPCSSD